MTTNPAYLDKPVSFGEIRAARHKHNHSIPQALKALGIPDDGCEWTWCRIALVERSHQAARDAQDLEQALEYIKGW